MDELTQYLAAINASLQQNNKLMQLQIEAFAIVCEAAAYHTGFSRDVIHERFASILSEAQQVVSSPDTAEAPSAPSDS